MLTFTYTSLDQNLKSLRSFLSVEPVSGAISVTSDGPYGISTITVVGILPNYQTYVQDFTIIEFNYQQALIFTSVG